MIAFILSLLHHSILITQLLLFTTILHSHHPIITPHTCIIVIVSSRQYSHLHNPTCQLPLCSHSHTIIVTFTTVITHAIAPMQSCLCNHICAIALAKFPLLYSHPYIITTQLSSLNYIHITTITHLHPHNYYHLLTAVHSQLCNPYHLPA